MSGMKAKYWDGCTPAPDFFAPVDPCREQPNCPFDLSKVLAYAKAKDKKVLNLTYDEVQQFAVGQ